MRRARVRAGPALVVGALWLSCASAPLGPRPAAAATAGPGAGAEIQGAYEVVRDIRKCLSLLASLLAFISDLYDPSGPVGHTMPGPLTAPAELPDAPMGVVANAG